MLKLIVPAALAAASVLAIAPARAQHMGLFNPGFEIVDPSNAAAPQGWHPFSTTARRRTADDMLSPPALIRSGTASIEVGTSGSGGFTGFTTNILDTNTFLYYDPIFTWMGGDLTVSGYYAIPASDPIVGDTAGIKLELRRDNESIYQAFEQRTISGHTNGQWVHFSIVVHDSDLNPNFPPFATTVSVLPFRFSPDGTTTSGTIFWDDLTLTQGATCRVDVNGDGAVNVQDFLSFLQLYSSGDARADFNQDGSINVQDFLAFLAAYAAGCP
jgi:hypothetical protein